MNYSQGQTVGWMLLFFCGAFQLWDVPFVNPRCPLENTKYGITKPYELIAPHQLGLYAHYAPYGWFYPHHCWPYPYSSLKRDRKCYHSVVKHWSLPHLAYPKIPWLYPPIRIFVPIWPTKKTLGISTYLNLFQVTSKGLWGYHSREILWSPTTSTQGTRPDACCVRLLPFWCPKEQRTSNRWCRDDLVLCLRFLQMDINAF